MALIQHTEVKASDLAKITLEYGDIPVKLMLIFKDGKQNIFMAVSQKDKEELMREAKALQEEFGL